MIRKWREIGKNLVGSGRGLTLRYHRIICSGRTEEKHESLNQDSQMPGPRFETGTSRVQCRSVNHMGDGGGSKLEFIKLSINAHVFWVVLSHSPVCCLQNFRRTYSLRPEDGWACFADTFVTVSQPRSAIWQLWKTYISRIVVFCCIFVCRHFSILVYI
jgi:hypothetical protein